MGYWRPGLGIGLWLAWTGATAVGELSRRSVPPSEHPPEAHDRTPLPLTAVRHAVGEVSKHLASAEDYRAVVEELMVSESVTVPEGIPVTAWVKPVSETMLIAGAPFASIERPDR